MLETQEWQPNSSEVSLPLPYGIKLEAQAAITPPRSSSTDDSKDAKLYWNRARADTADGDDADVSVGRDSILAGEVNIS